MTDDEIDALLLAGLCLSLALFFALIATVRV